MSSELGDETGLSSGRVRFPQHRHAQGEKYPNEATRPNLPLPPRAVSRCFTSRRGPGCLTPTGRFCVTRKPSMAWLLGDLGLPVRRQGSAGAWLCVTPWPQRWLPIAAGSWRQLGCGFHGAEHSWSCSCPARVTSHPHEERPRGGWSPAPAPPAELTPPGHVRLGLEWAPSSAPPAPRSLSSLAPSLPLKR